MVTVRRVRMRVSERRMPMPMTVSLGRIDNFVVRVIVMFVVDMPMLVRECRMLVHMLMVFAQMQPDTQGHQGSCGAKLKRDGFAQ